MKVEALTSLVINMTEKPPANFLELEELSTADTDGVNEDTTKPFVELLFLQVVHGVF